MKLSDLIREAEIIISKLGDMEIGIGGLEDFPVRCYVDPDTRRFIITLQEDGRDGRDSGWYRDGGTGED